MNLSFGYLVQYILKFLNRNWLKIHLWTSERCRTPWWTSRTRARGVIKFFLNHFWPWPTSFLPSFEKKYHGQKKGIWTIRWTPPGTLFNVHQKLCRSWPKMVQEQLDGLVVLLFSTVNKCMLHVFFLVFG